MTRATKAVCVIGALGLAASATLALAAPTDMPKEATDAASSLVRGDVQQALDSYTQALKDTSLSNDRRATILNDRGVAFIKLGQARQAIEDFNLAAQLFPEFAAVYNNRGNLLLSLGLVGEAVKDFDRAILLAPGYAAAYNNRAGALMRLDKREAAIEDYTTAIRLLPQNPAPLSGRGRAHLALYRPHAAIRDFTRAVNADARFAAGYRNRAEAKLTVEHYEDAIEDLSRAIAFDVNHAESYTMRGQAYLTVRNTASAIKDFSQAIEIDQKSASAFALRGFAQGIAEAYDEAYADLNKAIELDPRYGPSFAYRAWVYKQNGQLDVADRDLEMAVKLAPDAAEVHWAKAEIAEARGNPDAAIAALKKALALKPGYRDANESLVRLAGPEAISAETVVDGAGVDTWRVVKRNDRYLALNDQYPRLAIPLEMMGEGTPRLLEWQLKEPPFAGIGVLRFDGGKVTSKSEAENLELMAVVDLETNVVIAIEPHRQGKKVATWTWGDGKVSVATIDGVTDEFSLRLGRQQLIGSATPRPYEMGGQSGEAWAPWADPTTGGLGMPVGQQPTKRAVVKKKPKTLFDMLFQ